MTRQSRLTAIHPPAVKGDRTMKDIAVTAGLIAVFVVCFSRPLTEEMLWRVDQLRAVRMMRRERRAEEYIRACGDAVLAHEREEEFVSVTELAGWDAQDKAAFERAMREWQGALLPTFKALQELDVYWAEDWEVKTA